MAIDFNNLKLVKSPKPQSTIDLNNLKMVQSSPIIERDEIKPTTSPLEGITDIERRTAQPEGTRVATKQLDTSDPFGRTFLKQDPNIPLRVEEEERLQQLLAKQNERFIKEASDVGKAESLISGLTESTIGTIADPIAALTNKKAYKQLQDRRNFIKRSEPTANLAGQVAGTIATLPLYSKLATKITRINPALSKLGKVKGKEKAVEILKSMAHRATTGTLRTATSQVDEVISGTISPKDYGLNIAQAAVQHGTSVLPETLLPNNFIQYLAQPAEGAATQWLTDKALQRESSLEDYVTGAVMDAFFAHQDVTGGNGLNGIGKKIQKEFKIETSRTIDNIEETNKFIEDEIKKGNTEEAQEMIEEMKIDVKENDFLSKEQKTEYEAKLNDLEAQNKIDKKLVSEEVKQPEKADIELETKIEDEVPETEEIVTEEVVEEENDSNKLKKAIEKSKRNKNKRVDYSKINNLYEQANRLQNDGFTNGDTDKLMKAEELRETAKKMEQDVEVDFHIATNPQEISELSSRKCNEQKCKGISRNHQEEYGGEYREIEVTNQNNDKVNHAIVLHDDYVFEPQTEALIDKDSFATYFKTDFKESKIKPKSKKEVTPESTKKADLVEKAEDSARHTDKVSKTETKVETKEKVSKVKKTKRLTLDQLIDKKVDLEKKIFVEKQYRNLSTEKIKERILKTKSIKNIKDDEYTPESYFSEKDLKTINDMLTNQNSTVEVKTKLRRDSNGKVIKKEGDFVRDKSYRIRKYNYEALINELKHRQEGVGAKKKDKPKTLDITIEGTGKVREEKGLKERKKPEPTSEEKLTQQAEKEGFKTKAVDVAKSVNKKARPISAVEQKGMQLKYDELEESFKQQDREIAELYRKGETKKAQEAEEIRRKLAEDSESLLEALEIGGSEQGKAFAFRALEARRRNAISAKSLRSQARKIKGGRLTADEITFYNNQARKLQESYDNLQKKFKEQEEAFDKAVQAKAQELVNKWKKKTAKTTTSKKKLQDRNKQILEKFAKMGKTVNFDVVGATTEELKLISELVANNVRLGAKTLEEAISKTKKQLPDFSAKQIITAISGKYQQRSKSIRSDETKRLASIKKQAQTIEEINKINKSLTGKETNIGSKLDQMTRRLEKFQNELGKTLSDEEANKILPKLQNALSNLELAQEKAKLGDFKDYRQGKILKGEDIESPEKIINSIKKEIREINSELRYNSKIKEIERAFKTGDFSYLKPQQRVPLTREATIDAKLLHDKLMSETRRAMYEQEMGKTKKMLRDILNTPRTLMTMLDLPPLLRQGGLLSSGSPIKGLKAYKRGIEAMFSGKKFDEIWAEISTDRYFKTMLEAKLDLTDPTKVGIAGKEEMFQTELLDKIPILSGAKNVSERGFTSFLNLMRFSVMKDFMVKNQGASRDELRAMADYINKASGKGDLGSFGTAAKKLSNVFMAPKYTVSKYQTPLTAIKYWNMPKVRNRILRDYMFFFGNRLAMVLLPVMMGRAETSLDPRDADFGRLRIGNVQIDPWSGTQPMARMMARLLMTGRQMPDEAREKRSEYQVFGQYLQYKLNPWLSGVAELYTGRNLFGKDVPLIDEKEIIGLSVPYNPTLLNRVLPLSLKETVQLWNDESINNPLVNSMLSMWALSGGGINIYEKNRKRRQRASRRKRQRTRRK